ACYLMFLSNVPATSEISTLSLHDALPIWLSNAIKEALVGMKRELIQNHMAAFTRERVGIGAQAMDGAAVRKVQRVSARPIRVERSEEHTSELQSLRHLVCRLLLEKKKNSS